MANPTWCSKCLVRLVQENPDASYCGVEITPCNDDCDCTFGEYCRDHVCTVAFSPWPQCFCAARDCAAGQVCAGDSAHRSAATTATARITITARPGNA